jgi:L-fucose isomerase-like protein
MSKQLKRNNVKFSYIENCDIENPVFDKGIKQFFSVATMAKNFFNAKILQIGTRVKPFKSIMYNELELAEKFGMDIVAFNLAEAKHDLDEIWANKQAELDNDLIELKNTFDCGTLTDEYLKKMLAIVYYYENLAKENNCNIISSECWTGITLGWGANPCLAMCLLASKGVYVTCEWDIHMTITNILLLAASRGKAKPIQGEFTCRHPENDNAELLWHCGPFPLEYKAEGEKPYLYNTKPSFRMKDGEYTLARFQGEKGKYYLLGGKFHTCEGPKTFGTYMWAEFKDWAKLERKIVEGPYIHHVTEVPGDYTAELKEFAKYVDGVEFDSLED